MAEVRLRPVMGALLAAVLVTGCAALPPTKESYATIEDLVLDLPKTDYFKMTPARVGDGRYVGFHVFGRGECPTFVTIRVPDHQFRHWRLCKGQAPQEFSPDVRPFPKTVEGEFMVEQLLENLHGDQRRLLMLKEWNGYRIMATRVRWTYDEKGCQPMRGYVFDLESDGKKHKGLVYFVEENICAPEMANKG